MSTPHAAMSASRPASSSGRSRDSRPDVAVKARGLGLLARLRLDVLFPQWRVRGAEGRRRREVRREGVHRDGAARVDGQHGAAEARGEGVGVAARDERRHVVHDDGGGTLGEARDEVHLAFAVLPDVAHEPQPARLDARAELAARLEDEAVQAVRRMRVRRLERVQHDDRQAVFISERDRGVESRVLVGAERLHEPAEHVVAAAHLHPVVGEAARAEAEGVEAGHRKWENGRCERRRRGEVPSGTALCPPDPTRPASRPRMSGSAGRPRIPSRVTRHP